jgi:DNA-binding XRE family transcriptional regulator
MKTVEKKVLFKGFTSHEENVKKLKKTNPAAYKSLKNPDPKACLAWNLIEIRNKKHLTQKELSDKSGVSLRTINYIENLDYGYNATLDVIQKVAKALGVSFRDLLQDVDLTED